MTTDEFRQAAEEYIDSSSLANAIGELAEICRLKSQHIQENWQDRRNAADWFEAAIHLDIAEENARENEL